MVGLAFLRGSPGLWEVKSNLSSWLVWQMSFFCFPVARGAFKMFFWALCCFFCERVPCCWPVESCSCEWCCMWTHAPATLGNYWKPSPSLFVFAYLGFGFGLFWVFFFGLFAFYFSTPATWQGEDMKSLPASLQAKLRKQNGRRSAILCQHSRLAACRLHVGRGWFCPSPARAPGGWKASQRHGALISHWEVLPVPGTFWHRRAGLRLYKGWKQCLLLKERLCCFMVSSSLLPLLHFIQCSLINQISSSKLRSLSSYSPKQALCLPVLKAERLGHARASLLCRCFEIWGGGGTRLGCLLGVWSAGYHELPWALLTEERL